MYKKKKILIVEDDKDTARLLQTILPVEQYDAIHAATGLKALDALSKFQPDLILSDISMPGMDGFQFLEELKKSFAEYSSIPVVMITGHAEVAQVQKAVDLGASDYIVKPFDGDLVRKKVEQQLSAKFELPQGSKISDGKFSFSQTIKYIGNGWLIFLSSVSHPVDLEIILDGVLARQLSDEDVRLKVISSTPIGDAFEIKASCRALSQDRLEELRKRLGLIRSL